MLNICMLKPAYWNVQIFSWRMQARLRLNLNFHQFALEIEKFEVCEVGVSRRKGRICGDIFWFGYKNPKYHVYKTFHVWIQNILNKKFIFLRDVDKSLNKEQQKGQKKVFVFVRLQQSIPKGFKFIFYSMFCSKNLSMSSVILHAVIFQWLQQPDN